MKNKFFSLLMVFLLCFISVPTIAFANEESDFMYRHIGMAKETEESNKTLETKPSCHDSHKALFNAMIKVKKQGGFTNDEIKAIHKFYKSQISSNKQLPADDKELLDLLYNNTIITKTQYDQVLEALQ